MNEADLKSVLSWRNRKAVREVMYTQHLITEDEHEAWWARVSVDDSTQPFIFHRNGHDLGFVSFTSLDQINGTAFWAFYSSPNAPRGTGSLMEYVALEQFFLDSRMRKLSCEVLSKNESVIRLHEGFGFVLEGTFVKHVHSSGVLEDVVRLAIFEEKWSSKREEKLVKLSKRISS